jgi:antitoxin ParD1/3/4
MRTNIDIDDQLMSTAMEAGPYKTKKEAVEAGLRLLARQRAYDGLRSMRGRVTWDAPDEHPAPNARKLPTLASSSTAAKKKTVARGQAKR